MRLWHQALISKLPRQQLLGQHRECCALRGKGWQRKHATVNYVFDYSPYRLFKYHELIMQEMTERGYRVSPEWLDKEYRGKQMPAYDKLEVEKLPKRCICLSGLHLKRKQQKALSCVFRQLIR